jgi:hypothetical protein
MRNLIDIIKEMEQVNESPEEVRSEIVTRVTDMADEKDLKDVLKYTNRFAIRNDVTDFATIRKYSDVVSKVILQSLADADLPPKEVQDFLKKLSVDGILKVDTLLEPGVIHSLDKLIDTGYRSIFDKIKNDLFSKLSGSIGERGAVGKGEYLLSIMSPKINRTGGAGDLDVDGNSVEVKAGTNGRVGPYGSFSLAGRFPEFLSFIQELVRAGKLPSSKLQLANDPIKFNPTKLKMTFFTDFFETEENVKLALGKMLAMHYGNNYDTESIVNKVVGSGGSINGDMLAKEMMKASFTVYKDAKGFAGILVLDETATNFLYIDSPESMAESSGKYFGVTFPSWIGDASNCMKISGLYAGGGKDARMAASSSAKSVQPAVINEPPADIQASAGGVAAEPLGTKNTMGRTYRDKSRNKT